MNVIDINGAVSASLRGVDFYCDGYCVPIFDTFDFCGMFDHVITYVAVICLYRWYRELWIWLFISRLRGGIIAVIIGVYTFSNDGG